MEMNIKDLSKEQFETELALCKTFVNMAKKFDVNVKTVQSYARVFGIKSPTGTRGAKRHAINEDYFADINTEHKAYWLGFIMADGCIYAGSNGKSLRLQINLSQKDKSMLEKFLTAIESDYKIQDKLIANKYPSSLLKVNSTKMCNDLINQGVTRRKSLKSVFPVLPQDLEHHFIRGYFDGDGCISCTARKDRDRKTYTFSICCGIDMANALQTRLYGTSIYKLKRNADICYVETGSVPNIYTIRQYLYSDATVYMERKKKIFDAI